MVTAMAVPVAVEDEKVKEAEKRVEEAAALPWQRRWVRGRRRGARTTTRTAQPVGHTRW